MQGEAIFGQPFLKRESSRTLSEQTAGYLLELRPSDSELLAALSAALPTSVVVTVEKLSRRLGVSEYEVGCRLNLLAKLGMVKRRLDGSVELISYVPAFA